ncbi:DNA-3-methyladenine glycosylase [Polystyrenella longa]|uniref:DNA-3-methyladenine glycosylase II n=1 Tax=Polystyrenella longa TaxID=2528007 RepID=A0A518CUE2_9PLAN|nr:DNA-3-methyladenine glycosylase [Polystyrenella longa]QDU82835.1 DNA-3-methyladenine glycosylase [Polystyrenella longa]
MSFIKKRIAAALFIADVDPHMRKVIRAVGDCRLTLRRNRLHMLTRSIVGQQLSTKASRTIYARFCDLLPDDYSHEDILKLSEKQIRSAGLSRNKHATIFRIATAVEAGDLPLKTLGRLQNEEIVNTMTQLKGIGPWTAQMFLIFSLGRLDVLPHTDLGIRSAFQQIYGLSELPTPQQMTDLAAPWSNYASIGAWYCWQGLDRGVIG